MTRTSEKFYRATRDGLAVKSHNRLKPTMKQARRLKKHKIFGTIKSVKTWCKYIRESGVLYVNDIIDESIIQRASYFAQSVVYNGIKKFIYMDGHGRMTYYIIRMLEAMGENPDKYTFIIVDNDEGVNEWHNEFLPDCKNIVNVHSDILDYLKDKGEDTYSLYLNFCGIGGDKMADRIMEYLDHEQNPWMLTFSINRGASDKYGIMKSKYSEYRINDSRKDMVTYYRR